MLYIQVLRKFYQKKYTLSKKYFQVLRKINQSQSQIKTKDLKSAIMVKCMKNYLNYKQNKIQEIHNFLSLT